MSQLRKKVLCFSATFYKGHEFKDLEIVNKLKKNNFDVSYCVKSNEMFKNYTPESEKKKINLIKKIFLKNLFDNECGFNGLDIYYKKNINFVKNNTIWINKWTQLYKLIDNHEIIILGSFRDNLKIVSYARSKNKIVLVHKNPANFDNDGCILPNIYCLKSNEEKETILTEIKKKKIYKVLETDSIEVTGSVQYNFDENQIDSKDIFFKKYNLDINKKLFLFLPTGPQNHDEFFREDYIEICKIISKNHNLLIKGHPTDYSKRKLNNFYNEKFSWEILCPEVKVIQPEEFHKAIYYCDAGITIFSTVFLELNNFRKPVIFVNRFDHYARRIVKKKISIENQVYDKEIKDQIYEFKNFFLEEIKKQITENIYKNEFVKSVPELLHKKHKFVGCDIKINQLEKYLLDFNLSDYTKNKIFKKKNEEKSPQTKIVEKLINYINNNKFKPNYFLNYLKIKKIIFIFKLKKILN